MKTSNDPEIFSETTPLSRNVTTPRRNMSNPPTTPKSHIKASYKRFRKAQSSETPDCFSKVLLETPKQQKSSTEKTDEVSNLIVAVRIRPMNAHELSVEGAENIVRVKNQELILSSEKHSGIITDYVFQYDHIFWSVEESNPLYATQEDVFLTVGVPLLNSAFRGFNACLFAYGQTGSGKSYSMMGKDVCEIHNIESEKCSGLIPRFCRELFRRISTLKHNCIASVEVSYFEIYNEKIHDLLATSSQSSSRVPLKVREHPIWGPYVENLSTHLVKSYEDLRNFLVIGNNNRATAATVMNEKSSRSHSICSIELCLSESQNNTDNTRRSKVSLVDLAGSERLNTSLSKDEQIKEGVYINKSLLTLGKVISTLADQKRTNFVPYRESVLTWLLKESLGGNSLTSMLATITPSSTHLEETLATLKYACQARFILNRARINESPHDRLIRELRCEVRRLKDLRQDFEQSALLSSASLDDSNSNQKELDGVKQKLMETENRLHEAQKEWEQRFKDTKRLQLQELAEVEKSKAELESKFRILQTVNDDISVSPYRSNFLEELEGVLTDDAELCESDILNIRNWCNSNGFICTLYSDFLLIINPRINKQAIVSLKNSNLDRFENISDFVSSLNWMERKVVGSKLTKSDIATSMNQIYQILVNLQPSENENDLSLLFAKVNKTLQSYETALLNNAKSNSKTVTFNV